MVPNPIQRSLDWYRIRLGNFTGSQVGKLFVSGRKKDEYFGQTALSYITKVAAERMLNPEIIEDDNLFEEYLYQTSVSSKALDWGTQQEENARNLYEKITKRNLIEVSSCKHPVIPHFASSPDGFYCSDDIVKGCIEIKCPNIDTYIKYRSNITDNDSLKAIERDYYYQCQSHMMCAGADWCDFIIYNPFIKKPIKIVRIIPNEDDMAQIADRVNKANKIVDEIINTCL